MPLPAVAAGFVGRVAAWTGVSAVVTRAFPAVRSSLSGLPNRIRSILPQSGATAAGIGGGAIGGFGLSEIFDRLGIEDQRLQTLSIIGVVAVAIYAIGQLFEVTIDL